MNLLAMDTAGQFLSAAVSKGEKIYLTEGETGLKQSELIMVCIDNQMKKASLLPSDLDAVLCTSGPGSFTGLRIGYSIAKGLALSLSLPFYPIPTLDCIAFQYNNSENTVLPLIQARKGAFFYTIFRDKKRLIPDTEASAEEITGVLKQYFDNKEKIIICGNSSDFFIDSAKEFSPFIEISPKKRAFAAELISIAKSKNIFHNEFNAFLYSGPEYIRKTDAELNLPGS